MDLNWMWKLSIWRVFFPLNKSQNGREGKGKEGNKLNLVNSFVPRELKKNLNWIGFIRKGLPKLYFTVNEQIFEWKIQTADNPVITIWIQINMFIKLSRMDIQRKNTL